MAMLNSIGESQFALSVMPRVFAFQDVKVFLYYFRNESISLLSRRQSEVILL